MTSASIDGAFLKFHELRRPSNRKSHGPSRRDLRDRRVPARPHRERPRGEARRGSEGTIVAGGPGGQAPNSRPLFYAERLLQQPCLQDDGHRPPTSCPGLTRSPHGHQGHRGKGQVPGTRQRGFSRKPGCSRHQKGEVEGGEARKATIAALAGPATLQRPA